MKKSLILLVFVLIFSCNKDDGPKIPEGDAVTTARIVGWRGLGTVCAAPKDVNGIADLEITFNGGVPSTGKVSLQSRWKLPTDESWTYEVPNVTNIADLSKNGNTISLSNGYCWGLADSIISCEFTYIASDGTESDPITIDIPRPE